MRIILALAIGALGTAFVNQACAPVSLSDSHGPRMWPPVLLALADTVKEQESNSML
jgi:hypothetical protein